MEPGAWAPISAWCARFTRKALSRSSAKQRRNQGHIRQVGAAQEGIVEYDHITGPPLNPRHNPLHGVGHAAKMHRDVSGLGAEPALRIEYRTGEIEPVADIRRKGRIAQHRAHLVAHRLQT